MINLFENYSQASIDLEASLARAGYQNESIVLHDDGFLPEHVQSPLQFFLEAEGSKTSSSSPKFFNELDLPNYWEIRGDSIKAEIYEGYKKKGSIHYSSRRGDYRIIQSVDWLNEQGKVRGVDLYDQYGRLFGKKTFSDGEHVLTTYYNPKGQEIILFNHITQTLQLFYQEKQYIFKGYLDFILFYFECANINTTRFAYNTLGLPFLLTLALKDKNAHKNYQHSLFWQEKSQELPGNMGVILSDPNTPTKDIVVQDREEYLHLKRQLPAQTPVGFHYLGYLYHFQREANLSRSLLIFTNSDQLERLQEIVEGLPDFKINIAARTEMSEKLMRFAHYSNVQLFPVVTPAELEALIAKSSVYLDINHGNEVENIIRKAFESHLLILAFKNTVHDSRFIAQNYIFDEKESAALIAGVKASTSSLKAYRKAIGQQLWAAGESTVEDYKEVLK